MFPIDDDVIEKLKESISKAKDMPVYAEVEYDYGTHNWVKRNPTTTEISNMKAEKIKWIKAKAAEEITNILPIYRQLNLIREGKASGTSADPRFAQLDAIRTKSDNLEAQVNAAATVTEINAVVW